MTCQNVWNDKVGDWELIEIGEPCPRTAALVSALEFYADEETWVQNVSGDPTNPDFILDDFGDRARAALAAWRAGRE